VPCPFDCFTCDSNGSCLTCNGTSDHRGLLKGRCAPLEGYFEGYATVAEQCPSSCLACSSPTNCSACKPNYEPTEFGCSNFCPNPSASSLNLSSCQDLMPGLYLGTFQPIQTACPCGAPPGQPISRIPTDTISPLLGAPRSPVRVRLPSAS
jgi:hypothetical protein